LRFSNQFQYLVWNAHIKDKLKETFKIANIYVSGTSQFDYIYEHKNNGVKIEANKKYVYFCLSTGLEKLVIRELNVIIELAKFLSHNDIDVLVRPYPLFRGNYYDYIVDFPSNLFFEKIEIGANLNLHDKVEKISNAICVIHTGSTIGIESFLLGTPSFLFVDDNISSDAVSLKNFALQQQNLDFYFSSNYFIINGISDFFKILDICSFELDKSVNYFKNNFFKFNSQILLDSFSRNV
jgi:hypothetical protein